MQTSGRQCHRCGNQGHNGSECRLPQDVKCHNCSKKGHLRRACRSTRGTRSQHPDQSRTHQVEAGVQESDEEEVISSVNSVEAKATVKPYTAVVYVNEKPVTMEIDTGAVVSLISQETQKALFPRAVLLKPSIKLRTYTTARIHP